MAQNMEEIHDARRTAGSMKHGNTAVSDDEMANISGGSAGEQPPRKFDVGDKVIAWMDTPGEILEVYGYYDNVWIYRIRLEDTGELRYVAEIMLRPR